jgi:uncharacterized Zn-finger protein
MLRHSTEKPYICNIIGCGYKAKQKNSLNQHTKKYHT